MGVWPPGAGLQGQAPNHPMLLRLRGVVVSDGEKADLIRQVSDGKMSASESPTDASKSLPDAVKTGAGRRHPDQCGRYLLTVHAAAGVQAT
jgi:hypothetical protein